MYFLRDPTDIHMKSTTVRTDQNPAPWGLPKRVCIRCRKKLPACGGNIKFIDAPHKIPGFYLNIGNACIFLGKGCKKKGIFNTGTVTFLPSFSTQNWLTWFKLNFLKILLPRDTFAQKIVSCVAAVWQNSKNLKVAFSWKYLLLI